MDRRDFLSVSALSLAGLCLPGIGSQAFARKGDSDYSMVILGDTHYDTKPDTVYHSCYNEKVEWLNRVQRAEFARNGDMWEERCPRMVKRAACLVDESTRKVLQMGDLIQGDCGNGEVHKKMLGDVMDYFNEQFGDLPFVTVVGNHDIRGVDAKQAYHEFMPARLSSELGASIDKTTFSFAQGNDVFIFIDFNDPDDVEIEKLLADSKGARNTFIVTHAPVIPADTVGCRWFFHGGNNEMDTEARRYFRRLFAKRNAICLCGHIHSTEIADWYGDGGRITQMTMNSVWSKPELGRYEILSQGASEYGEMYKKVAKKADGSAVEDESALFEEYRPGLRRYSFSKAAGSYKMKVSGRHVIIDFFGGDSSFLTHRFELR
jgi:Calcineurin-like phosphoesterase.